MLSGCPSTEEGLVGQHRHGVQLCLDLLLHCPNPGQVGVDALFQLVEDLLPFHIDLHAALCAGGHGDAYVSSVGPEELVCHPRGSRVVLSRDTVDDLNADLPILLCHLTSSCSALSRQAPISASAPVFPLVYALFHSCQSKRVPFALSLAWLQSVPLTLHEA